MIRLRGMTILALTAALAGAGSARAADASLSCPEVGFTLIEAAASAATRPVTAPDGQRLHVRREALTTTADIVEARAEGDGVDGKVLLKFRPEAAARLVAATTGNPGVRIAFIADDRALLAITWNGEYGLQPGGSQVSLSDGHQTARRLVDALRPCVRAPGS